MRPALSGLCLQNLEVITSASECIPYTTRHLKLFFIGRQSHLIDSQGIKRLYLPFATGESLRFTRRVAPSPSDPTPSATSLAQTSAASCFPPKRGAAGNLRTPRATTSAVR